MAGQTSAPEVSGWKAGVISHLRSGQVSRIVYGSIIGLAFILTLERHPPTIGTVIGTLVATGVAVALAELYSEALGASTRVGLGGEAEPWSVVIEDTIAVFFGVAFPVIFFIFAWVGWIELQTGVRPGHVDRPRPDRGVRVPGRQAVRFEHPASAAAGQRHRGRRGSADRVQGPPALGCRNRD